MHAVRTKGVLRNAAHDEDVHEEDLREEEVERQERHPERGSLRVLGDRADILQVEEVPDRDQEGRGLVRMQLEPARRRQAGEGECKAEHDEEQDGEPPAHIALHHRDHVDEHAEPRVHLVVGQEAEEAEYRVGREQRARALREPALALSLQREARLVRVERAPRLVAAGEERGHADEEGGGEEDAKHEGVEHVPERRG